MAGMFQALTGLLDRAEILAAGLERVRSRGVDALERGRYLVARACALRILRELPLSPTALALWGDAAVGSLLDNEAVEAFARLGERLPFRADVWLRLARSQAASAMDARDALQRAVAAAEPLASADAARMQLAQVDLDLRDPARAEQWVLGLSLVSRNSPGAAYLLAEAKLEQHDTLGALAVAKGLQAPELCDGRSWLTRARLLQLAEDPGAGRALARAWLLDAPGAGRAARQFVGQCKDVVTLARFAEIARDRGVAEQAVWQAAFATAEGRRQDALRALASAARHGWEAEVIREYLDAAVAVRNLGALRDAVELADAAAIRIEPTLREFLESMTQPDPGLRARRLETVEGLAGAWAHTALRKSIATLCPDLPRTNWDGVLELLTGFARESGDFHLFRELESLARALRRPVQVAVAGEFNAGKSSFLNALLGEAVAPTGVVPTTATLNRLCWGPDRVARIVLNPTLPERLVAHASLVAELRTIGAQRVEHVEIFAPIGFLRRAELIDTPGFNSALRAHESAAARALAQAHVVVWVLDGTQPLKESDRRVLLDIGERRLPLLMLINKRDRLGPDGVASVEMHVARGLAEVGIRPLSAPIAFSAKQALAEDATVRAGSGLDRVADALERFVVARSGEHRARALAVRAHVLARRLSEGHTARQSAQRAEREARMHAADRLDAARRALRADSRQLCRVLEEELRRCVPAAREMLRPLAGEVRDGSAEAFAYQMFREHVATPVAQLAVDAVLLSGPARAEIQAVLGAIIVGSLMTERRGSEGVREPSWANLASTLVQELTHCLSRQVSHLRASPATAQAGPRVLDALAERLSSLVEVPDCSEPCSSPA